LNTRESRNQSFDGAVFDSLKVETSQGPMTLELDDFRLFNINPAEEGSGKRFRNFGPNFTFKLRNAAGEAREYENYMLPVEFDGRPFFLSGVRSSVAEPFSYLHLPADPQGGLERFMRFNALLRDPARVSDIALQTTRETFGEAPPDNAGLIQEVATTMQRLVDLFARGGFDAIAAQVEQTVPEDKRAEVLDAYIKVLRNILTALYFE